MFRLGADRPQGVTQLEPGGRIARRRGSNRNHRSSRALLRRRSAKSSRSCVSASPRCRPCTTCSSASSCAVTRSEEHTSELQSRLHLVCRLLLEKKKTKRAGFAKRDKLPLYEEFLALSQFSVLYLQFPLLRQQPNRGLVVSIFHPIRVSMMEYRA